MRLIDGDALKEAFYQKMKELLKSTNTPQISNEALSLLCGATLITEAPTIEPLVRKTGKWIFNPHDGVEAMFTKPKCSVCGFESADGLNYCSNCGAKMIE